MQHQADPYSQRLYDLCGDFFALGLQVGTGHYELPSCEALMRRVLTMFEGLRQRANQEGVVSSDVDDAQYALAAYIDEVVQYSSWPGRTEWSARPLQAVLFNETRAGVHFFTRLEGIRRRSGEAARIYYACLALGFNGEYRMSGGDIDQLTEDLRRELFHGLPRELSPHGSRPDDRVSAVRHLPLLPIAVILMALALVTITTLFFWISSTGDGAVELLEKMGRG